MTVAFSNSYIACEAYQKAEDLILNDGQFMTFDEARTRMDDVISIMRAMFDTENTLRDGRKVKHAVSNSEDC